VRASIIAVILMIERAVDQKWHCGNAGTNVHSVIDEVEVRWER
jgi:hypothetical protein